MSADGLRFLYQVELKSKLYFHIPEKVHSYIQSDDSNQEAKYHWNYDEESRMMMISVHSGREERSEWLGATRWDSSGSRIKMPKEAAAIMDVEQGDCIYLLTHDDMKKAGTPSVFVWDFDRIERALLSVPSMEDTVFSRLPNF
jgi:hypothetical protein